jgi:hypothetical protein
VRHPVAILNPISVTNTDGDPNKGIGGYHGLASVPYLFVNVFGQNLTVDVMTLVSPMRKF